MNIGEPFKGCSALTNADDLKHRIVVLERGECMFIDKVLLKQLTANRVTLSLIAPTYKWREKIFQNSLPRAIS